ncbi:hypothetical protein TCAP_06090 [Tolypocladium capitatum]|uniref:Uncharacterized protein n=1 Tax=Tolypocladium capitatum TaxID=45235 RepID=A0A2K3Q8W3_9HYPO|nr:hypothetical protein TCAP_06090 [Tolypocladium capitatum]
MPAAPAPLTSHSSPRAVRCISNLVDKSPGSVAGRSYSPWPKGTPSSSASPSSSCSALRPGSWRPRARIKCCGDRP